jgi:hypothetical protein
MAQIKPQRAYIKRNHRNMYTNCVKDVGYKNKHTQNTREEMRRFETELQTTCKELKIKVSNHNIFLKKNKEKLIRNDSGVHSQNHLLDYVKSACLLVEYVKFLPCKTDQVICAVPIEHWKHCQVKINNKQ